MKKWLKHIVGIVIIILLLFYLVKHWHNLKALLRLGIKELIVLYFICILQIICSASLIKYLLSVLGVKALLWDLVLLQNTSVILNYLPMKFGTLFQANYLKRRYGLSYARFAPIFMCIILLMIITASTIGITVLLIVYGLTIYEHKVLALIFFVTLLLSIFFLFIPIPNSFGPEKLKIILRKFLTGRKEITHSPKVIFISILFLMGNFMLVALRLTILYHSLGEFIHPGGYIILGALAFLAKYIGITPGGLGIREIVLGYSSFVLGIPLEIGLLAAVIDRGIILSFLFVIGGICAAWLWHKYPGDFRKSQISLSESD